MFPLVSAKRPLLVGTFPTHFNPLTSLLLIQNFRASPTCSCVWLLSGIQCFSVLPFPLNPQACCQPPAPLLSLFCGISHCIFWAGFLTNSEIDKTIQMLGGCNENGTAASSLSGISSLSACRARAQAQRRKS